MSKTVKFYNEYDEVALTKRITGLNIQEIERKAHAILNDADTKGNRYYNLYLVSFHVNI